MANRTTLGQKQEQKQVTTTSAAQVMLSNIMEMPIGEFEQFVQNEIDSNDALEQSPDENDFIHDDPAEAYDFSKNDEYGVRDSHTSNEEYDDYLTIDQVPEDLRNRFNGEMSIRNSSGGQFDGDEERVIADTGTTSYEDLITQIGSYKLTDDEKKVIVYLIGSLDERGYLIQDDDTLIDELNFQEYIEIEHDELTHLIHILQSCEPAGIGARNLQDCLLLQMRVDPAEKQHLSLAKRLAHKVIRDMFDDLSHSRWEKIQNALDVNDEAIKEIQHTIHHLNPKPGSGLNESIQTAAPTVIPDFYVYVDENDEPSVIQSRGNIPELRVSDSFTDIISDYKNAQEKAQKAGQTLSLSKRQEEAYLYASHKVDSAKAFIENIRRRRHTLQAVMEGIVKRQREFFINQDDEMCIKPMVLQDIADYAQVDVSTVSRAANSKYVKTEYNTYPLKFFFGTEFTGADGESVSQREALLRIKEIIENEDSHHPLSDQKISDMLKEDGLTVARRTIAKYRDRLGYSVASQRRR